MRPEPKIYPSAKERLLEIWEYTEEKWGEEQADRHLTGFFAELESIATARHRWKPVPESGFEGVFVARYRHHFVFFRELPSGALGIISVLHEAMDLPNRLREAVEGNELAGENEDSE